MQNYRTVRVYDVDDCRDGMRCDGSYANCRAGVGVLTAVLLYLSLYAVGIRGRTEAFPRHVRSSRARKFLFIPPGVPRVRAVVGLRPPLLDRYMRKGLVRVPVQVQVRVLLNLTWSRNWSWTLFWTRSWSSCWTGSWTSSWSCSMGQIQARK